MAINYEQLMNFAIPDSQQSYSLRDTLFYALSIGVGADPLDERQLGYVYERSLQVMPSMATVLASTSGWMRAPGTGINPVGTLAVEQSFDIHAPIPASGSLTSRARVTEVIDRGPDRGAYIFVERRVTDDSDGTLLFTATSCTLARKDGGFGGPAAKNTVRREMPSRAPDEVCDLPTTLNLPLWFRLHNRLDPNHPDQHADPALARSLGLPRPSMHGLCTLGMACHALLRSACDYDASRLKSMTARFSKPAFPGETLRTEIWREGESLMFQCSSVQSGALVLAGGRATVS